MEAREFVKRLGKVSPILSKLVAKMKANPDIVKSLQSKKSNSEKLLDIMPMICEWDEIYELVGCYYDKTSEEIEHEDYQVFIKQLKEVMLDKDIQSFTKSIQL